MRAKLAGLAMLVALTAVACQPGSRNPVEGGEPPASPPIGIGQLHGTPIADVIGELDGEHAQLIRFALATVPTPLPPEATPFVQFLAEQLDSEAGIVEIPSGGTLRNRYVVVAPGSNALSFNLVCLRNFEQVPCTPAAGVWHVTLTPLTLVQAPIQFAVREGDRLDFLLLIEGDSRRPTPASEDSHVDVGAHREPRDAQEAPQHAAVFGGCDFATITTRSSYQRHFQLPREQPLSRQLFLIVQPPCDSANSSADVVVRAVEVIDRSTVVAFPGLTSATRIVGRALVMPIPRSSSLRTGSEMQIVVFREVLPGWVTHAVKFIA